MSVEAIEKMRPINFNQEEFEMKKLMGQSNDE